MDMAPWEVEATVDRPIDSNNNEKGETAPALALRPGVTAPLPPVLSRV